MADVDITPNARLPRAPYPGWCRLTPSTINTPPLPGPALLCPVLLCLFRPVVPLSISRSLACLSYLSYTSCATTTPLPASRPDLPPSAAEAIGVKKKHWTPKSVHPQDRRQDPEIHDIVRGRTPESSRRKHKKRKRITEVYHRSTDSLSEALLFHAKSPTKTFHNGPHRLSQSQAGNLPPGTALYPPREAHHLYIRRTIR